MCDEGEALRARLGIIGAYCVTMALNSFLGSVPLNTIEVAQGLLNIDEKTRTNPFPWNGQFSPQLVEVLLKRYASDNSVVLDPFAGSGTLLYESGRKSVCATVAEINPAAYCMARTYEFINLGLPERLKYIDELENALQTTHLLRPSFKAQQQIEIRKTLAAIPRILSQQAITLFEALVVLLDLYKPVDIEKIIGTWTRLRSTVEGLPFSQTNLKAINCDARKLPLANDIFDLVITSPPYINVFNYHQHYRASAEFLGWNLLSVAKSEIGSNRKHRGNRFLTVIQYCLDMGEVFSELSRVCKKSARVIFVVGRESKVRGTPFFNGELVALVATECAGFKLMTRQERVFLNRFGEHIYEDILHFVPSDRRGRLAADPKFVARSLLEKSLGYAPDASLDDIKEAIKRTEEVLASPTYTAQDARLTS